MFRWLKNLFVSRSQPCGASKNAAPEAVAKVEQAKEAFEAAVRLWPRDRAAVTRAWEHFRDARCDQIRSEIGR